MLKKLFPVLLILGLTACSEPESVTQTSSQTTQTAESSQTQSEPAAPIEVADAKPGRFKAGEDYQVLDTPATETPTVTEFFSFYCPHCYQFEPLVQQLKQQVPDNAKVVKNHVSFMGGDMGSVVTRAYATAVVLNAQDTIIPVMFDRIHAAQNPPKSLAEVRQMFVDNGIDGQEFDGAYNSFAANSMAKRFDQSFEKAGLRGVPAVVVNGKYHVTPKTVETPEEYFQLINFLLTQK
ncbi:MULTISPECIES: thiol:disulfide interchange protein DsbA/DsbL [Salinivibrio]|uniref:thiol:disulfide interchange protein DsbA/DsbL n=1 Tax=Salinivibrio TaxID=51366 RepID=UPI0009864D43|nr:MULTISPECIES: thiol:disulfide interchange protein DsbA/DsbL [Salinivibrio]QCP03200.1 thiol:disulfide interchange protein DsbA/DsbL [Salinivibrio kushneri]WBA11629.1 thiol:disulfide interchange protein DsbA/DsbL [Salinivibrio kushneri]WBA17894.1 thiol:disulfide interchange protein DsbA/DsbL [Salinivibrio kushneri]